MKLKKQQIIIFTRDSHFFTTRAINLWNSLPNSNVGAPTVSCFKSKLDKVLLYVHSFYFYQFLCLILLHLYTIFGRPVQNVCLDAQSDKYRRF